MKNIHNVSYWHKITNPDGNTSLLGKDLEKTIENPVGNPSEHSVLIDSTTYPDLGLKSGINPFQCDEKIYLNGYEMYITKNNSIFLYANDILFSYYLKNEVVPVSTMLKFGYELSKERQELIDLFFELRRIRVEKGYTPDDYKLHSHS